MCAVRRHDGAERCLHRTVSSQHISTLGEVTKSVAAAELQYSIVSRRTHHRQHCVQRASAGCRLSVARAGDREERERNTGAA